MLSGRTICVALINKQMNVMVFHQNLKGRKIAYLILR